MHVNVLLFESVSELLMNEADEGQETIQDGTKQRTLQSNTRHRHAAGDSSTYSDCLECERDSVLSAGGY